MQALKLAALATALFNFSARKPIDSTDQFVGEFQEHVTKAICIAIGLYLINCGQRGDTNRSVTKFLNRELHNQAPRSR